MTHNKYLKIFSVSMLLFTSLYTGCGSNDTNNQSNNLDLEQPKVNTGTTNLSKDKVNTGTTNLSKDNIKDDIWTKDISISSTYDRTDENDHKFSLLITFNKNIPSDIKHFQIYLNIDNDNNTGLNIADSGIDYMIEDGTLYKATYKTVWKWEEIVDLNYIAYEENNKFKIKISDNSSKFISITDIDNIKNLYVSIKFLDKDWNSLYSLIKPKHIYIDILGQDDKIPFGDGSFSVFERVAIFPTIKDEDGETDYLATYKKTKEMALNFAKYVTNKQEAILVNNRLSKWKVCGVKKEDISDDLIRENILQIPTTNSIDPALPYSPKNTKKIQVIELSNNIYPKTLLDIKTDKDTVSKLMNKSTVFPFEVSIFNDDKAIYVDILNPEAMFGIFFAEVFDNPYYKENFEFREKLLKLPTQAKNEIISMIYSTFNAPKYETSIKMGLIFSSMSKLKTSAMELEANQYIYFESDTIQTTENAKEIAQKIINTMTIHGSQNAGKQESLLFNALPSVAQQINPKWVSARHEPFKGINGSWIVEACSPIYAKQALNTGEHHATALPCEISVYVDPKDNKKIVVSILKPAFMFKNLFADSMIGMNKEEQKVFQTVINNIQLDLKTIVEYTMDYNVDGFKKMYKTELSK